jgi:hypothetical protein
VVVARRSYATVPGVRAAAGATRSVSQPPPENLMDWPKGQLASEVARLRAILREHAEVPADPPRSGGDMVDVAGDPHARGGVVLDMRESVLMDYLDVALVDTKHEDDTPAMMLVIEGRVNYQTRRVKQAYLFGADGAAALVTQLAGLAARAGGAFADEFRRLFDERMTELP